MKKEFAVLQECLQKAARVVRRHFGKVGYELKGKANLVTKADVASQKRCWQFCAGTSQSMIFWPKKTA